jgi:protein-L-isoaspartate O-methyltransferase
MRAFLLENEVTPQSLRHLGQFETMHKSSEMLAYYAARAPYYDAVYLKPERAQDIAFLSTHLPVRFEARDVIEVACGTGYWTQFIAQKAKSLHATDATQEPLEFAKLRPNVECATFTNADAYELPASLAQFDAAFAGLWFSHVPKEARKIFFASLHARLVSGTRVILIDNSEVQCLDYPIVERDDCGNTYQSRGLNDGSTHRVLKNFPSEAELADAIALHAKNYSFMALQNFWLLEYQLR